MHIYNEIMRQNYYLIIAIAILAVNTFGIRTFAQEGDNYYTLQKTMNDYYNTNPGLKDEEDGGYQQFIRWQEFWRYRVDCADTSLSGKFSNLRRAYDQYRQSQSYLLSSINPSPWSYCGPVNVTTGQNNGLVSAVYVDTLSSPTLKTIYVGTNASGIWKTVDGGQNWTNITDASGFFFVGVSDIKGDPTNSNIIYATTAGGGYFSESAWGIGVLRSTDAGATWHTIYSASPSQQILSNYLLVDPTNPSRLFAGIDEKVIRLQLTGTTWTATTVFDNTDPDPDVHPRYIRDIEMKPGCPDTLYIATDSRRLNKRRAQVVRITGATTTNNFAFQLLHPFCNDTLFSERYEIAVNPLTPKSIYVVGQHYFQNMNSLKFSAIWKTVDNGVTWEREFLEDQSNYITALGGGRVDYHKMELQVSPTDTNILYVGGNTMSRVIQTTGTWQIQQTTPYSPGPGCNYHADTRASVIIKGSFPDSLGQHDVLFCGNDGGVSKTSNGIRSWENINGSGLWITEFGGIGSSKDNPYWIGGGSIDNGFFTNASGKWERTTGPDIGSTVVDFESPNIIHVNAWSTAGNDPYPSFNSFDYGLHFEEAGYFPTPNEACLFNKPIVLNPKNSKVMYSGAYDLFRTHNARAKQPVFTKIPVHLNFNYSAIDSAQIINCIAIAETDTNTILIAYAGPHWGKLDEKHKLLVSHDRGETFVDLLASQGNIPLLETLTSLSITSIAISPLDADKMWVTLGGFAYQDGQNRVYYSSDGGESFSDISAGLPNFPVNCIKYWKGGNDRIFVGTDVGVFYKEGQHEWQPWNDGLPVTMISNLEILENSEILRAATFGRGIWQTFLYPCSPNNGFTKIITSNETWTIPVVMDSNVLVKAPATLTIKTTVRLPGMTKIMVEPGAALALDSGCVLTHACYGMWLGIEVWGDPTKSQTSANQGSISIQNGAMIENSRIGITTCRKDNNGEIDWNTTGGMIHASNSTFRNNFKAIEFLSYPFTNKSTFNNVSFETEGPFPEPTSGPQTFVSLFGVTNVRFLGCRFINYNTDTIGPGITPDLQKGNGIVSIDAGYTVDELCTAQVTPCNQWIPSYFCGLYYGIKAENTIPVIPPRINKCQFVINHRNIYLSGIDFAQITSSRFLLPHSSSSDTIYGAYLNSCTGYKIQENSFRRRSSSGFYSGNFIGIIVNNSGVEPNEIYNNSFYSVRVGILAQRINRSVDGITGLCLKCNDFSLTRYDQAVTYPIPLTKNWGVSGKQGSDLNYTSPAGNRFAPNHVSPPYSTWPSDISNEGLKIDYFHHPSWNPPNLRIIPTYRTPNVYLQNVSWLGAFQIDSACPSKVNSGNPIIEEKKAEMAYQHTQVDSIVNQLAELIDGGNTQETATDINFSVPADAMQLHEDLLSVSPYLSDTVMKSAILRESVLPNEMIRDILVANPQAAKSDSVLDALDSRFVQMPESMMDEILEGLETIGAKERLEAQLGERRLLEAYSFYELVRFYKADTNGWAKDSLMALLENSHMLSARYMLAFEHLSGGELASVTQTLNNIPAQFELSLEEASQYDNYLEYFQLLSNLKSQNLTIFDINIDQQNQLMELSQSGMDPVQTYARNILIANNLVSYNEPVDLPDETKSIQISKQHQGSRVMTDGFLKIFPNPAKQYVIVEYNLTDKVPATETLVLTIITSDGKTVVERGISKLKDQMLIDCRNLNSGSYICKVNIGRKTVGLGKFIIIR